MTAPSKIATPTPQDIPTRPYVATLIIGGGLAALAFTLGLSVAVGAADVHLSTVWEAVFHYNPELGPHQIIHYLRLPRALAGAMVGAAFAVAGALMQGMTRNPLADSGLLGINAGSGLALAICFALLPELSFLSVMLYSFLGAGVGAGLVYGIGSLARDGLTPVRLAIAGAAVSALLLALSEGVAIYFRVSRDLAFWYAGGIAGTMWLQVNAMLPWVAVGLVGSIAISRSITMLSLGDEIATGLGVQTRWVKVGGMALVLVLAGAAVAAVGSIGFVGLIVPHIARYLVGTDYRWVIPCSAVLGSLLMLLADIAARMVHPPYETPVGALIALIGVPFFLYLARRGGRDLL